MISLTNDAFTVAMTYNLILCSGTASWEVPENVFELIPGAGWIDEGRGTQVLDHNWY